MAIELEDAFADTSLEMTPEGDKFRVAQALQDAIGAPAAPHVSTHMDGGADELIVTGLAGLLADAQRVEVAKAGTVVGTRKRVNLIQGPGASVTVADNAAGDRVDVTVGVAEAAVSEFWCPPETAHAADIEGVLPTLGPYTLVRASDWTPITPVPATPVSGLSSPAASTVRLSYNVRPSHISVQPAVGYSVALLRTFAANTRPAQCQFRMRCALPVPQNANANETSIQFALAADGAGGMPDGNNLAAITFTQDAANSTVINPVQKQGGTFFGSLKSLNLDTTPVPNCEFIISCNGSDISVWVRSGSALHKFEGRAQAGLAVTARQHLFVLIASAAAAAMPFAPVYHIDYMRQVDSADVF